MKEKIRALLTEWEANMRTINPDFEGKVSMTKAGIFLIRGTVDGVPMEDNITYRQLVQILKKQRVTIASIEKQAEEERKAAEQKREEQTTLRKWINAIFSKAAKK